MAHIEKVLIIGIEGAEPGLILDRWLDDLPNLRHLCENGLSGHLTSCIPPMTIPAWTCMASGKDPGALGVYGIWNRRDWDYENLGVATNLEVRQPRIWDHLARSGHESILISIPQTFPIVRPPKGCMLTGLLTPNTDSPYAHPPELAAEIERLWGDYLFDVTPAAGEPPETLLDRARELTRRRFDVARHFCKSRPWTLLWLVDTGLDRAQHALWHLFDPDHPDHQPDHPLADAIRDYYRLLDRLIGDLLGEIDLLRTAVWVVSNCGTHSLNGHFRINDWLGRTGLLVMRAEPTTPQAFQLADVDWSRTSVWAHGGPVAHLYFNQAGREPLGIVPTEQVARLGDDLAEKLQDLVTPHGDPIPAETFRPAREYSELGGHPPDLFVHLGGLHWAFDDSIGHADLWARGGGTGSEGSANPTMQGVYMLAHGSLDPRGAAATIYDILPTTLECLGLPVPRGLRGRSLLLG